MGCRRAWRRVQWHLGPWTQTSTTMRKAERGMDAATCEKLISNLSERRQIWKRRGEILPVALEHADLVTQINALTPADLEELAALDERSARLADEAARLWR